MIKKKKVGDVVVAFIDGKSYSRTGVDDKEWTKILEACSDYDLAYNEGSDDETLTESKQVVIDLLDPERVKMLEEKRIEKERILKSNQLELDFDKRIKKAKRIADISDMFEYDEDGICYLKGFSYPMNKTMVEALLDAKYNPNSQYSVNSLVKFWKYLLLNPDKHVREGLFKWIDSGKFSLTEDGNIISYRNVDIKKKGSNKELNDFVSEQWAKIKRWKKSPNNYGVIELNKGGYKITTKLPDTDPEGKDLGNLAKLYADMDTNESDTVYTDNFTRTMEIKIGEAVSMPRSECDNDPNAQCSRGLHQKAIAYGQWLGNVSLVCLTNPYNVVAIPDYDSTKFRCCEYYPLALAELDDKGQIIEFEPGTYDIPYNGLESLEEMLETTSLEELKESGEISNEVTEEDFESIYNEAHKIIVERKVEL